MAALRSRGGLGCWCIQVLHLLIASQLNGQMSVLLGEPGWIAWGKLTGNVIFLDFPLNRTEM